MEKQNCTIEEILEAYKPMVLQKASHYFMLGAEKEDLIQEGMIGLVKAYNHYDETKGASFKTFAELCVNRQMLNAVKSSAGKKNDALNNSLSLDVESNDDEGVLNINERISSGSDANPEVQILFRELLTFLSENPDNYFSEMEHKVLLCLLKGEKYKEIAETMGKSPKQIDNTIQRIRLKIKSLME